MNNTRCYHQNYLTIAFSRLWIRSSFCVSLIAACVFQCDEHSIMRAHFPNRSAATLRPVRFPAGRQCAILRARNSAQSVHSLFPSRELVASYLPLLSVAYHYGLACAAPGHSRLISSKIPHLSPSFARFRDREL